MYNAHIECITKNMQNGTFDAALIRDYNSASFPAKNFSGLCYIRKKSNSLSVYYSLRVNYGKPARLYVKTTSIVLESNTQELNDLWNLISEIETKKRQKSK